MGIVFIAGDKAFVAHLPESCSICQLPCHDRILAWLASHDICSFPVQIKSYVGDVNVISC